MAPVVSIISSTRTPLDKTLIERAVEALISEKRMVRRNGVVGWLAEDWDAARRLLQEVAGEPTAQPHQG
jgi:hypothetical protein